MCSIWTDICCEQTQSIASAEKETVAASSLTTERTPVTPVTPQYFPDAVNQIAPVLAWVYCLLQFVIVKVRKHNRLDLTVSQQHPNVSVFSSGLNGWEIMLIHLRCHWYDEKKCIMWCVWYVQCLVIEVYRISALQWLIIRQSWIGCPALSVVKSSLSKLRVRTEQRMPSILHLVKSLGML